MGFRSWTRERYIAAIQQALADMAKVRTEEQANAHCRFVRGLLRVAPRPEWRREAVQLIQNHGS
jgi:hypothetical protein